MLSDQPNTTEEEYIAEIQRENLLSHIGRSLWAVVDLPNGRFGVYSQSAGGAGPLTEYNTKRQAAARLLQLMETGPVAPQTWPERIEIGYVRTRDENGI